MRVLDFGDKGGLEESGGDARKRRRGGTWPAEEAGEPRQQGAKRPDGDFDVAESGERVRAAGKEPPELVVGEEGSKEVDRSELGLADRRRRPVVRLESHSLEFERRKVLPAIYQAREYGAVVRIDLSGVVGPEVERSQAGQVRHRLLDAFVLPTELDQVADTEVFKVRS